MILVTGGAGFVGSHVVDLLVQEGNEVRVLDLLLAAAHVKRPDYLNPEAEFVPGDVADPDVVRAALTGVDVVCHQAAMVGLGVDMLDVEAYVRHNDLATAVLLRQLAQARYRGRLVLASSMVVYGEGAYRCPEHGDVAPLPRDRAALEAGRFTPRCPTCHGDLSAIAVAETSAPDPRNVYAATKLHQEHLCGLWARESDAVCVALRYHNVYGPGMPRDTPYAGVASIFRSALAGGQAPLVFEDGGQRRDFVSVADVATANVLALTGEAAAGRLTAYNIASGTPHTVGDMATELARAAGGPAPVVTGEYRLGDVRHIVASPARASAGLGFRAGVGFEAGMRAFATAPLRSVGAAAAPPPA